MSLMKGKVACSTEMYLPFKVLELNTMLNTLLNVKKVMFVKGIDIFYLLVFLQQIAQKKDFLKHFSFPCLPIYLYEKNHTVLIKSHT
jgi:hypothetical protein